MALKEVEDLLAGLKLTPEEKTQMEAILGTDERQNVVKSGFHGKAEADRLMTQARQAEEAARVKETEAADKINGWLKWYEAESPKADQYLSDKEAAERKATMLSNYLASQGIDPNGISGTAQPVVATPEPFDMDKVLSDPKFKSTFIPREEAQQSLNAILALNDVQHKINLRHRKLVGSDIDDFAALRQEAFAAKKQLDAYADEKYGFTAKEQALADKALEERAERMAQERLTKLISEQGIPKPTGDPLEGTNLFTDQFTNNTKVSEGDADRAAMDKAMRFDMENPNHAADMAGVV